MFIPTVFAETNLARLHEFIQEHSFGLLVSQVDGSPFANHLPFLLRPTVGSQGALVGHMARENPQWSSLAGQTTMAVFSGPHVYVSPTWYEAERVVPTWNFTAVHVYGRVEIVEDGDELRDILKESVEFYERSMPEPWKFDDSATFAKRLMEHIVGIQLNIERIEGKFKLNQNQPLERRVKVMQALQKQGDENSLAVAKLMKEALPS